MTRDNERRLREARQLHNGAGDAYTVAVELAVTPALFGFFGWLLDRWLGTTPVFLVVLFLGVAAYEIWKLFARYDERMKAEEQKLPLRRRGEGLP